MKILITGGAGYAGSRIAKILATEHRVSNLDIRQAGPEFHESLVGDITDPATCDRAVQDVDAAVLCHMAGGANAYETPVPGIDINTKGTANIYHAMAKRGIKRGVLISTTGVLRDPPAPAAIPGEGPYSIGQGHKTKAMYSLSKIMQEFISRHYFETDGIITTILRPGWIVDEETLITKYGQKLAEYASHLIDPHDIGKAVLAALRLLDPRLEAFTLIHDDSSSTQVESNRKLGWQPRHRFEKVHASA